MVANRHGIALGTDWLMTYIEFLQVYSPRFVSGSLMTMVQFFLATIVSVVVAFSFGLLRLSPNRILRGVAISYIEFFRGTSLLVQLYWIFFVLPLFGISLDKYTAGIFAIGLNMGAYGAELVRSAVLAVPKGQWEAAIALNMSRSRRMWRVIVPQALVIMLPPWGNLVIEILKGTALVALISVADLTFESRQINITTYLSAQAFGTALIVYYIIARLLVTPLMRLAERVMAKRMGMV